jgi:hypothetical protein
MNTRSATELHLVAERKSFSTNSSNVITRGWRAALGRVMDASAGELPSSMERQEAEKTVRQLVRETLDEIEAKVMTVRHVRDLPLDAVTRTLNLTYARGAKAYVVSVRRKLTRGFNQWRARKERRKGGGHAESQA